MRARIIQTVCKDDLCSVAEHLQLISLGAPSLQEKHQSLDVLMEYHALET